MGIKQELVEASGFELQRPKVDRQDYLAGLARAVNELQEAEFDLLSVDAQDWFNDAVRSLNKKQDITEFSDADTETEVEEAADAESDADEEADPSDDNPEVDEPEEKPVKAAKAPKKGVPPRKIHTNLMITGGEVDKWGFVKGSKNSAALDMFEKGCRMSDVTESIGGTYYNALAKATKRGHTTEKKANGMITITYVSPSAKPAKKGKK